MLRCVLRERGHTYARPHKSNSAKCIFKLKDRSMDAELVEEKTRKKNYVHIRIKNYG